MTDNKLLPDSISDAFDDKQEQVLVNLDKAIRDNMEKRFDEGTESYIDEALKRRGIDKEVLGLSDQERAFLKIKKAVQKTRSIFDNNGYVPGVKDRISLQDLHKVDAKRRSDWQGAGELVDGVFSTDQPLIIPRVMEEMIREPVEPTVALTPLLQTINVSNAGTTITFPAVGDSMVAADIAEGAEYPESSLEFAGQVTAKIGKSGIAVKLSEEMIRYSMYDVMAMHIRAAGRALVRHKERKTANLIFNNGVTVFDNTASSGLGTSGRGSDGASNNTMTLDDILIMYADMVNEGFIPDIMIVHPFAWFAFVREPVMRSLFMQGAGGAYFNNFQGNVGSASAWNAGGLNNSTVFGESTAAGSDNVGQVASTYTLPGILPTPLRVVVTPYQEVDLTNRTSTVTLADSARLGMILVDETVQTDEFNDVLRDLHKVKFRERYGLALHDNGQAIRHAKKVNWWNRSYALDDFLTWEAGTGALPALDQASVDIV